MAEQSRVNSSTAAVLASGGSAGFSRPNTARDRDTNTTSPFVLPALGFVRIGEKLPPVGRNCRRPSTGDGCAFHRGS